MARRPRFTVEAKAEIRAIDQTTAMRILTTLDRYLRTCSGDVKRLEGFDPPMFRLRVGDWRIFFRPLGLDEVEISAVRHRREAYR